MNSISPFAPKRKPLQNKTLESAIQTHLRRLAVLRFLHEAATRDVLECSIFELQCSIIGLLRADIISMRRDQLVRMFEEGGETWVSMRQKGALLLSEPIPDPTDDLAWLDGMQAL